MPSSSTALPSPHGARSAAWSSGWAALQLRVRSSVARRAFAAIATCIGRDNVGVNVRRYTGGAGAGPLLGISGRVVGRVLSREGLDVAPENGLVRVPARRRRPRDGGTARALAVLRGLAAALLGLEGAVVAAMHTDQLSERSNQLRTSLERPPPKY